LIKDLIVQLAMRVNKGLFFAVLSVIILLSSSLLYYQLGSKEEGLIPSRIGREAHKVGEDIVWISHKAKGEGFQVLMDGKWNELLVKGVNMGISKPGHLPGETAITYEEYYRWFGMISDMDANVVRVYTVHPPAFYEALYNHNRRVDDPLFIIQGIYTEEETLFSSGDAFKTNNNESFSYAVEMVVDVIHGRANILPSPGNASGTYRRDVSEYVLGLVLGLEWDPSFVQGTIEAHPSVPDLKADFIETDSATAFEVWLASLMDHAAYYETKRYHEQRPLSFANWPTTDKLEHPYEPFYDEDLVSIDPDKVLPTWNMVPGLFATYHVYPYYPDLMTLEPSYAKYINKDGSYDNYAGYLHDLKRTHLLPVLIGEFGVPSSRGIAHEGLYGMDHGHNTEQEQGEIISDLFDDIVSEGLAGGIIFSWQDEWFKRTWNTMELTEPDRRAYWMDVQTCEQHFGLLSFDPASEGVRTMDGNDYDWMGPSTDQFLKGSEPIQYIGDGFDDQRTIRGLRISHDEAYINIGMDTLATRGLNWDKMNILILIDTLSDQGSTSVPFGTGLKSEVGFDFIIHICGEEGSQVLVDSYYDLHHYRYGHDIGHVEESPYAHVKDNGIFHPIEQTINKGFKVPSTGQIVPFKAFETGKLRWGCSDPGSERYDSLADISSSDNGSFIELRIPYLLLNFRDPSSRNVNADPWTDGYGNGKVIDGIRVAVVTYLPGGNGNASGIDGPLRITDSLPHPVDGTLKAKSIPFYTWDNWDVPTYSERLKVSYGTVRECFSMNRPSG
jgi:hypothetical protein